MKANLVHITTIPQTLWFFVGQFSYMSQRGLEIHAVSSPGDSLDEFGEREQITTHAVEMARQISPFRDLIALSRLYRELKLIDPQIVHSHTPKAGLLGMLTAWLLGVPVRIYHIHGLRYLTASGFKRKLLQWTERISCFLAHQVICVSHSVRDVAIQAKLSTPEKITVLLHGSANGVDALERFNPATVEEGVREASRAQLEIPNDSLAVGFVGRLVRDKGLIDLGEAWRILSGELPNLHLIIVGRFEPQDPLPQATIELLHSEPRIHLAGQVNPFEMPPWYRMMDILVLPTYREGFPVVPLEAASMSLPIVATHVPGCVDAVEDGTTGTLVAPNDPEALAVAIRRYVVDPKLRQEHGQAGRGRVLNDFQPQSIWVELHRFYTDLLEREG